MHHHKEGYITFLYKSDKNYAPVSWKSRKIQRVVRNTLVTETLAMKEALEECYIIWSMLLKIYNWDAKSGLFPIHSYTDNKSLLESVYSTKTLKEVKSRCLYNSWNVRKERDSIHYLVHLQ